MWPFKRDSDGNRIIGRARKFKPCINCGAKDSQTPRGRGEIITRGGYYVARQYFVCDNCDTKALWHRRVDKFVWTMDRSGW